jgi:peptidoglycan biosynthesis protein MviN/MurJ (putative lipid II flippase)
VNLLNAAITVLLNVVLVPTLGIAGAALALLCGRMVRVVQYWQLVGNERIVGQRWPSLLRIALASVVMGGVVYVCRGIQIVGPVDSRVGLLILIAIGFLVYPLALWASGSIERKEWRFALGMIAERLGRSKAG